MESKHVTNRIFLLPNYFKKVGLLIFAVSALSVVFAKFSNVEGNDLIIQYVKQFVPGVFILGLFFIAWSKDKIEDELTFLIRLKAMSWAFGWGVLYVVVGPLVDLILLESFRVVGGRQLVLSMLLVYLAVYYFTKRAR